MFAEVGHLIHCRSGSGRIEFNLLAFVGALLVLALLANSAIHYMKPNLVMVAEVGKEPSAISLEDAAEP